MPKKKHRSRKPTPQPGSVVGLVEEFSTVRLAAGQDPDDAWLIQPLAELKRDLLGSPDPTVWRADDLDDLLLDIAPRKILFPAEDRERVVPALADFLAFLEASGRWSPRSAPLAELVEVLDGLARAVPRALADPARRSLGGNVAEFALSQGFDLTNESGLADAMDRFNALPHDERVTVTETGRLPDSDTTRPGAGPGAAFGLGSRGRSHLSVVPDLGAPFGDDLGEDEDDIDLSLEDLWPDFLGEPADLDAVPPEATDEEMAAAFDRTELVRRADALLGWLGHGRGVTSTDALRRADTAAALDVMGIDRPAPRSMWEVPELGVLWGALLSGGFIQVSGKRARPAALVIPWVGPDGEAEDRVNCARLLFGCALTAFLGPQDDGPSMAHMPPLTFLALLKAMEPAGVRLPPPADHPMDEWAMLVREDLSTLAAAGVLAVADDAYRLLPYLGGMLAFVMQQVTAALDL